MSASSIFWITFISILLILIVLDRKYYILRDDSTAIKKPYSFSRVQMGWWTLIVISSFIAIIITRNNVPTFDPSTLILLGISSGTIVAGRLIDQSNQSITTNQGVSLLSVPAVSGENLFIDILSDNIRVRMSRFQAVAFNLVFGCWFVVCVLHNLGDATSNVNLIMPPIADNNLILIGLSSGTYAALKTTENKPETPSTPLLTLPVVPQGDSAEVPPVG